MIEAPQLPLDVDLLPLPITLKTIAKTMIPDNRRIMVKLAASICSAPNANRHSTEFPANANSAKLVQLIVLMLIAISS